MDRFWHQIQTSFALNMARVGRDVLTGSLDRTHLVPRSLDYWRALCGSPVDRMDQETWLKEIFEPHRKRLIDRDLVQGLDLCLPMGLRDDLSPRSLVESVSNDALWAALQQIPPIDDPASLLGMADIASSRAQIDSRFATVAELNVRRLSEPHLRRSDGVDIYALLLALISFISGELRTLPGTASQPAYWRQICSWTQAALLIRSFRAVHFDVDDLSKGLDKLRTAEAATAALIDLQLVPLSHPSFTNPARLRAEVLSRLLFIERRAKAQGSTLPGSNELAKAIELQATIDPFLVHMPGPLELERLPYWNFESLHEHFQNSLRTMADELTDNITDPNWVRFVYLGSLVRYDGVILDRIVELARRAEIVDINNAERDTAILHMAHIAYLATAQRCAALAEAVLVRILEVAGSLTDEQEAVAFFRIGLIATTSLADATDRLAQYLTNLAALLPQGAACKALSIELGVLRSLTTAKDWHRFNRAEALTDLGS